MKTKSLRKDCNKKEEPKRDANNFRRRLSSYQQKFKDSEAILVSLKLSMKAQRENF